MGKLFEVANEDEVAPGTAVVVDAGGVEIALVNAGGTFYAIGNECTHASAALGEGEMVDDRTLECPLHASQFDVTTGEVVQGPADEPVATYTVVVEGGIVKVEIE